MRKTAYKLFIKDLYELKESDGKFFLNGLEVSRVRLLGNIVKKFESRRDYGFIILDDSTETIRIKIFDKSLLNGKEVGDLVDVIGRVRKADDEIFIVAESMVKLEDPNWEILRKLEILEFKLSLRKEETPSDPKEKIINLLKKSGELSMEEIAEKCGIEPKEVERVLNDLMLDGIVYEPIAGRFRLVE